MRSRLAIWVYLLLVFLGGIGIGILGDRFYESRTVNATRRDPETYKQRYVAEMRRRLKLNEDQLTKLNGIMDETRERWKAAHDRIRPDLEAIQHDQVVKINTILDDPQRFEYAKMRKQREEQRLKQGSR